MGLADYIYNEVMLMKNFTTDDYVALANHMGYMAANVDGECLLCTSPLTNYDKPYTPIDTYHQFNPIFDKLRRDHSCVVLEESGYTSVYQYDNSPEGKSLLATHKSIEHACIEAMLVIIKLIK